MKRIPGYNLLFHVEPHLRSAGAAGNNLHLPPEKLSRVEAMLDAITGELDGQPAGVEAAVYSMLLELLIFLSRNYDSLVPEAALLPRVASVIAVMENRFGDPLNISTLARIIATSPRNFTRLFRRATGVSPMNYLMQIRLRHASEMLRSDDGASIGEIALRCGFCDSNHFAKTFRSVYGVTPRRYRRSDHSAQ